MLLSTADGIIARTPQEAQSLTAAGYQKCEGKRLGRPCDFFIAPEVIAGLHEHGGYYSCPRCNQSFNAIHAEPWRRSDIPEEEGWANTQSGLDINDTPQLGEDTVESMGGIPGYGNFEWFHHGGANATSPLDAMLPKWGVEIKTLLYDSMHHRFIPGGVRSKQTTGYDEKASKNQAAVEAGKRGVLGVLVLLNMRTSKADIYAKEMPVAGWQTSQGRTVQGVAAFRSNTGKLVASVPFKNPYMDPTHPAPHGPTSQSAFAQEEPIPF
jgi:hypothetical protein